jgi:hypothetical protein
LIPVFSTWLVLMDSILSPNLTAAQLLYPACDFSFLFANILRAYEKQ